MRWTRPCSVLGPRKMVRPQSSLRTYVQLTGGRLGSILGTRSAETCVPVPAESRQSGPKTHAVAVLAVEPSAQGLIDRAMI
jgi:hypothetical protein